METIDGATDLLSPVRFALPRHPLKARAYVLEEAPVNAWARRRISFSLSFLCALMLGGTVLGARTYWQDDDPARHALTVLLGAACASAFAVSVSIGLARRPAGMPWPRVATVALLVAAVFALALVRDLL
jgi:hypothetical protein